MDTRNGNIYLRDEMEKMLEEGEGLAQHLKEMTVPPTEKQMARKPPRVGRNEPCPCGSGRKFKKCCLKLED